MAKVIKVDKDALRSRWDYEAINSLLRLEKIEDEIRCYDGSHCWGVIVHMDAFIREHCQKTEEGFYDLRGFNFDKILPEKSIGGVVHFHFHECSSVDFSFSRADRYAHIFGNFINCKFYRCVFIFAFEGALHNCVFERYSGGWRLGGIKNYNSTFSYLTGEAILDARGYNKVPRIYENCIIHGKKAHVYHMMYNALFRNCKISGFFKPTPCEDYIEIYGPRHLMKIYFKWKHFLSFHPKLPTPVRFVNCDLTELNTTHFKIDPDVIFENCKLPESIEKTLKPGKYKWWNPLTWLYDKS